MSLPTPPSTLEGTCSAVYNNTLYVYTPQALMSIPLQLHGNWSSFSPGESVTGAVCVAAALDSTSQAALYVIGGTSSSSNYTGLQRFSFQSNSWETLTPQTPVTQSRLYHGATYVNGSSSLLVYGGHQNGNTGYSTDTFSISINSPYMVESYPSNGAPPVISPTVLPWDANNAVLLGGSTSIPEIWLFDAGGWHNSGLSLQQPIPSVVGIGLVLGADGSRVLETFNVAVSPNTVTSTVLAGPGGAVSASRRRVRSIDSRFGSLTARLFPSRKRKRGTLSGSSDLPTYNGTNAPQITRSNFALAQSTTGKVVISGGSSTDPICMFDQTTNSWVNMKELFNGQQSPLQLSSSSTTTTATSITRATSTSTTHSPTITASSTITATSTSSAAAGVTGTSSNMGIIIGAVLGSLLGAAALLIVMLMLLRWRRQQGRSQRFPNGSGDDKGRLSFQDQGIEPLANAAFPMAMGPVPSDHSLGKGQKPPRNRLSKDAPIGYAQNYGRRSLTSHGRTTPLSPFRNAGATIAGTGLRARTPPPRPPRGDRTTDEGWSKYFDGGNTTDLAGMTSGRTSGVSDMSSQDSVSDYRSSVWPEIGGTNPLNLDDLDRPKPLGRVNSGSPNTEFFPSRNARFNYTGQSAKISSADSVSDDGDDRMDAFSSGVPASIRDDPHTWSNAWSERPPSSGYTSSIYPPSAVGGGSNAAIHNSEPVPSNNSVRPPGRSNVNSDMSWLNLNADR